MPCQNFLEISVVTICLTLRFGRHDHHEPHLYGVLPDLSLTFLSHDSQAPGIGRTLKHPFHSHFPCSSLFLGHIPLLPSSAY